MTDETIRNYKTSDTGASQSLVTLECFIGDVDGAELADDGSIVDASNAVAAVNGLIHSLEQRDETINLLCSLVQGMIDNDPDDLAADGGVRVLDVWRKNAEQIMRLSR